MRHRLPRWVGSSVCIALVMLVASPTRATPARAATHAWTATHVSPATDANTATNNNEAAARATLPPASPALPLRLVARHAISVDQYFFRLSDGSAWVDVGGARSRLRPNALIQVTQARFGGAVSLVAGTERRRVRLLNCVAPPDHLDAQRCSLLRDVPATFE